MHRKYVLGCDQFEQLIARSGQQCEICGAAGKAGLSGEKLHIDHDHTRPNWAVRGLLCGACNSVLTKQVAERRPPWAADYLANSWWLKECERVGVPPDIAPEPDCGSLVVDQYGARWIREGDGLWRPTGKPRPGISSADWQWLYRLRGPHNIAPVDLWAVPDDQRQPNWDHLVWETERAALVGLLNASSTADVPLYETRAYGYLLTAYGVTGQRSAFDSWRSHRKAGV
jgi:hypothetical protein